MGGISFDSVLGPTPQYEAPPTPNVDFTQWNPTGYRSQTTSQYGQAQQTAQPRPYPTMTETPAQNQARQALGSLRTAPMQLGGNSALPSPTYTIGDIPTFQDFQLMRREGRLDPLYRQYGM